MAPLQQKVSHPNRFALQAFEQLSSTTKGVALALVSTALFTIVGVLVRVLSGSIDLFQILLSRQVVFIALLLPAIVKNMDVLLKPKHLKLHTFRILGAFVALYFGFVTVSNIPLADATALGFTQVLFVAAISRMFLAEQVSTSRLFTIIVGFIGVMLVVQPSFEQSSLTYTLLGLLSALGAAVAVICVRKVAQTEPRITLLAYQAIFVGLIALVPSLLNWTWPTLEQMVLLVCVGAISSVAQWIGITAYKYGEANVVANVEYAKIIYSVLFGYWLFAEIPNIVALTGIVVLILSAVLPILFKAR
ncbi:DMT family transporter [Vibrio sp. SCSIO 43135]|uniref:DMT family transporter n=1 Tax=Vibrio sp. SCSIO 43135 TaxID=2819096 RepID=UPI002075F5D6|nr:DMT family transporter [Vibrio sp. SCSIO 43135]USD43772.1 DMT family transporter [Vibrio sp. SCSIO 43135]